MSALLECVGCGLEDEVSLTEAKTAGWVRARGTWTCPDCADEAREAAQSEYDAAWPSLETQAARR